MGYKELSAFLWWQAMDTLMPGFDKEIAKLAQRILVNPRKIDYHTGVLATKVTPGMQRSCLELSLQPGSVNACFPQRGQWSV